VEFRSYDINSILKTAKYLLVVEDRIPPAFFVDNRAVFQNIISFYRALLRWKNEGYLSVEMVVPPDPPANVNQPFVQYYIWMFRLYHALLIRPSMKLVNNDLVF
jgi:hypothetical protein